MGAHSKIEWTDHTFNPWLGCTKISPACEGCYAEAWAKRSGRVTWGGPRRRTSAANWLEPLKWHTQIPGRERQRVFCASLADVFDNEVPEEWRHDLFNLIRATPQLDWLLLTKRVGNAKRMLPADWGEGYPNVWLGATIANREELVRDAPKLLAVPASVHFWSVEPMLEDLGDIPPGLLPGWVICGGESGGGDARPMHIKWARRLRDQCVDAKVPFFFKQWGAWLPSNVGTWHYPIDGCPPFAVQASSKRTRDFGDGCGAVRACRDHDQRLLDGALWSQYPEVRRKLDTADIQVKSVEPHQ